MKLAIVGSRILEETDENLVILTEIVRRNIDNITEIVSGGARGADTLAQKFAEQEKIPMRVFPADWARFGKGAGPRRNQEIVDHCDKLLAFYVNEKNSTGTKDSVRRAKRVDKLLKTYEWADLPAIIEKDLTKFFD